MAAFSNYLEDALINHVLRNTSYPTPGLNIYVALYTTDPTDADSGTEVTGGSYARQQVTAWDAPSNGATQNTSEIAFPVATGNWGTVTHVGIRDAAAAGNLLYHGILTAPVAINTNEQFKFAAGDLDVAHA